MNVKNGEYLAKNIPGTKFIELPGEDHMATAGDTVLILDAIEEFLTGTRGETNPDRVLATIMFTDIVDSTKRAVEIGDSGWKDMLLRHNEVVRGELARLRARSEDHGGWIRRNV